MRAPVAALLLMALFLRPGSAAAGLVDAVFGDGFEAPCLGIANDRPGCVVVPFNLPPLTPSVRAAGDARWTRIDVYTLLDRSGSMTVEIASLRNGLAQALVSLRCPPSGTGNPGQCIDDLWAGVGTIGYSLSGVDAYRNMLDLQPSPNLSGVPISEPAGCCAEAVLQAMDSTISAAGGGLCGVTALSGRPSCAGSPAANAGAGTYGYPCFRADAATVVVLVTDEPPSSGLNCPNWTAVVRPQYLARAARVIGVYGDGSSSPTIAELASLAGDTGAIDASNGGAPLVYSGAGANSVAAFEAAVQGFRTRVPMDVDARVIDVGGDAVDVGAFVQRIEVVNDGSAGCPIGAAVIDDNGDTFPDTFLGLAPGTQVCFRVVAAANSSVPPSGQLQFYPGKLRLQADGHVPIVDLPLTFTVPP